MSCDCEIRPKFMTKLCELRGLGMVWSIDMLSVETFHYIWWWYCTNKSKLLTCKFVWCQTRSWREDNRNSIGKYRGIHSVTLCAASALSLYYVMTFVVVMHYLVFNSLYTIFRCILQLTRRTCYWSFGSVGAPFLFLGK